MSVKNCRVLIHLHYAEVVVTWRLGPNASKLNETVIMSPVEQQHSYYMAPILMQEYPAQQYSTQQYPHTYHQPNAGQPSYPANQPFQQLQLQFLQPVPGQFVSSTPKYEDQSFLYQQQQQQYLQQQHHQQQQQQQQFQQLYPRHTYIAPAPGTTVTATPQPGGQPIVPYPSPGTSVAVSPVLPVGGFSTPSNAHTTISSNTPL
ncbi:hypothetical protein BGZ94_000665 [Podila epigama]|nr:hypothetical protein BGZ94_000665 [Podila epigama]